MWQLIDLRLGGRLEGILRDLQAQHGSNHIEIWFWLRTNHDVTVSPSTVARWLQQLDERQVAMQERAS